MADTCVVFDLSGQIQSAEEQYGGARQAAGTFFESFYYDEGSETLYFLDFQDSLYCVKINKGFGKKDIQDRVKLISGQVFSPETVMKALCARDIPFCRDRSWLLPQAGRSEQEVEGIRRRRDPPSFGCAAYGVELG